MDGRRDRRVSQAINRWTLGSEPKRQWRDRQTDHLRVPHQVVETTQRHFLILRRLLRLPASLRTSPSFSTCRLTVVLLPIVLLLVALLARVCWPRCRCLLGLRRCLLLLGSSSSSSIISAAPAMYTASRGAGERSAGERRSAATSAAARLQKIVIGQRPRRSRGAAARARRQGVAQRGLVRGTSARWVSTATARVGAAAAVPSRRAGATWWTQSAAPRRSARSVPPTRAGAWPRTSTRAASTSRRLVTQAPLGAGLRTTRHSTVGADLTGGPGLA